MVVILATLGLNSFYFSVVCFLLKKSPIAVPTPATVIRVLMCNDTAFSWPQMMLMPSLTTLDCLFYTVNLRRSGIPFSLSIIASALRLPDCKCDQAKVFFIWRSLSEGMSQLVSLNERAPQRTKLELDNYYGLPWNVVHTNIIASSPIQLSQSLRGSQLILKFMDHLFHDQKLFSIGSSTTRVDLLCTSSRPVLGFRCLITKLCKTKIFPTSTLLPSLLSSAQSVNSLVGLDNIDLFIPYKG